MMCDDTGHDRLRAAAKRLAPAATAARAEVAQESRNEETNEAFVTNNAENVKPRVDVSREDSNEVSSRIEDAHTPVGGQVASAEVSSRAEGVLPSRMRGSEERGAPEEPMLEHTDGSETCISVMTVILQSLGVASKNDKIVDLFSRNGLGGAAVDMGFERENS